MDISGKTGAPTLTLRLTQRTMKQWDQTVYSSISNHARELQDSKFSKDTVPYLGVSFASDAKWANLV